MENKNASFSEETSKAILDMLVRNSAEISVIKEQIALILSNGNQDILTSIQKGSNERYLYHSQRLKENIFANYGHLDIEDLLNL
jgi:hypothetical protein